MAVDTNSLTSVDEVLAYLKTEPQRNGLWVYCSQADATGATVEITDTTMVLIIVGGAQVGTNTLTFSDADKNTIAELVIAINALTGWTSGRLCHPDALSDDLRVTGAISCLASTNEITFIIKDTYLIERLIDRATSLMEKYCNRRFLTQNYTREEYWGPDSTKLILDQYPVTRISRLSRGRANSFSIRNTSTDANYCTVEVTDTKLRLVVSGGANVDTTDLVLADYSTIDALIAAFPSKGWATTLLATDTGSRDASELLIRPSMAVTSTRQANLETVDEDITEYQLIKPNENRSDGIVYYSGGFVSCVEYFIDYTAGYTTTPFMLEQVCIELVKLKYNQVSVDQNLKSERIGQVYEYTFADLKNGLPPSMLSELDFFISRTV